MEIIYSDSFNKDISKLRDKHLKNKIASVIEEIEVAKSFSDIKNIIRLQGFKHHYRIRVGDYRIGIFHNQNNQIEVVRFLNRKDIYTYFP